MVKDWPKMAKDLSLAMREVRAGVPDVAKAFSELAKTATATGALDPKAKELIAVAIAVAVRCDGCIAFHVKAAFDLGATREEIMETVGMSIYMGGGPSFIYGSQAVEAYDQFAALKA
ncbi:putative carboxymuconolactone decarboxylase family protein [Rhodospirillaceae bacterium LM-1]|nr:putative carboxymuconolactone decarboxylase family protein [Rhodospirillaceae bacterium LM-1]